MINNVAKYPLSILLIFNSLRCILAANLSSIRYQLSTIRYQLSSIQLSSISYHLSSIT